jgi:uncharacterized repeat protein (TIGR01451 family)
VLLTLVLGVALTALLGAGSASSAGLHLVQGGHGGALGPLARTSSETTNSEPGCVINTLPSFMDQGEFKNASSVADVVEVECEPVFAEHTVHFSANELYSRCQHHLIWSLPYPYKPVSGPGFTVTLDNDGNATAVILAGPGCAAGESLVAAHMEQAPFTTVTTAFTVLPPRPTPPGVTASPKEEVENEDTSSVATVVQVEFPPVFAEAYVNINAEQLYARCHVPPHLVWLGAGGQKLGEGVDTITGVQLDNDGNAFVMLLGGGSCASGRSEIEASLESAPYTTYTTTFTILPPQPTLPVAPEFKIEKLQRLEGEANFTKSELIGEIGDVVEYEIIVTNTGNTPLEFTNFTDTKCSGIGGGPTKPVQPGQSTIYTCTHTLTSVGTWTNTGRVTGNEGTGTKESNEVVVKVPPPAKHPEFTIEKLQRLEGEANFTKNELTGQLGQTVEYEIIVTNTGNVTLKFSNFTDTKCEGIAGGATELAAGASTTFTCHHKLTAVGTWTNVATIEGNEGTGKKESNEVVVKVPPPVNHPEFTIEKLQRLYGEGSFTKNELTGKLGQVVEYEIIVRNTGNVPLKFTNFTDADCEGISGGPGNNPVPVGGSTTFTCHHVLTSTGTWPNVATIEGNEGTGKKESNEVIVKVPAEPRLVIEKLQMLAGQISFTKNELVGEIGQVVYYEIIVTNTGNVALKLSSLTDVACVGIAGGATELGPGDSTTFTCMHTITSPTPYMNVASITGTPPAGQGAPVAVESNVVVVKAPEPKKEVIPAKCAVAEGKFVIKGASGPKRHKFTVKVSASGVKRITFYLDGRKIKTINASSSKHSSGFFTITIDPRKLKHGPHMVSVTIELNDPQCGPVKLSAVFVHPRSEQGRPNFTG